MLPRAQVLAVDATRLSVHGSLSVKQVMDERTPAPPGSPLPLPLPAVRCQYPAVSCQYPYRQYPASTASTLPRQRELARRSRGGMGEGKTCLRARAGVRVRAS